MQGKARPVRKNMQAIRGEGKQIHRAFNGKSFQENQDHRLAKTPSSTRQAGLHFQKGKSNGICGWVLLASMSQSAIVNRRQILNFGEIK